MRSFIAAATLIAGASAYMQSPSDVVKCADDALKGIDASALESCSDKSTLECYCSNPDALSELSDAAAASCNAAGIDFSNLADSLCGSTDDVATPARHASNPMMPATNMAMSERAYAPPSPAEPRVVYITETKTECGCRATPAPFDPKHLSQIPVNVPASSSMGPMASATPHYSNGVLVGASSASSVFGSMATPMPSGASGQRFNAFEGAAPKANVQGGVAAFGAAVVGFLMAL